jgi:hypothetical protein
MAGVDLEPTAVDRIAEARAERDRTRERADQYRQIADIEIDAYEDFWSLDRDIQRKLIKSQVARVLVGPAQSGHRWGGVDSIVGRLDIQLV